MAKRGPGEGSSSFWQREEHLTAFLVVLMALLFISPILPDDSFFNRIFIKIIFIAAVISGAMIISGRRTLQNVCWLLAVLSVGFTVAHEVYGGFLLLRLTGATLFCVLLTAIVGGRVFSPGPITAHRIRGAVAMYLLFAVIFGHLYAIAECLVPGSFHGIDSDALRNGLFHDFYYLSGVTLTTIGYGELYPISGLARSLAMTEGLIGQLYPVILLGRLVSLHVSPGHGSAPRGE